MIKHHLIKSKMTKTRPLLEDPILSQYVPELHWFSKEHLKRMLYKYNTIYVKPDEGSLGLGIRRLKLQSDSVCKFTDGESSSKMSPPQAIKTLCKELNPKENYLIQQGIDLSTYKGRPFHLRIVMQKPMDRWQVSLTSVILGKKKNALTTNVASGGSELPLEEIMYKKDQNWGPMGTYRELLDLSHQIVATIGAKLPILVAGLDLGIDKKGKIWFIEANTRPDVEGYRKFNDKISIKKYIQAKKWIRQHQK